nr:hypothetical protein BOH68_03170 [Cobetia sp. MM1IDA2H-1]
MDRLDRTIFSRNIAKTIKDYSHNTGFVISIEGEWGSGKTSILSITEEVLRNEYSFTNIINFNPWEVGSKDGLINSFFSQISSSLLIENNSVNARRAANSFKRYATALDAVKLIPGAEPWASIIKKVIDTTSDVAINIADNQDNDINSERLKLINILNTLEKKIVVFIDDMDRLFPDEVYEMIRIIKAIGDLPNIIYVVTWDSKYITNALEKAGIPSDHLYIDKIIQLRLYVPHLSRATKKDLINEHLEKTLTPEDINLFPRQHRRLESIYAYGGLAALKHPRDIIRVMSNFNFMFGMLKEQIAYPDIFAISIIFNKAPSIHKLMISNPEIYMGHTHGDSLHNKDATEAQAQTEISTALDECESPIAIKRLTEYLFPKLRPNENIDIEGVSDPLALGYINARHTFDCMLSLGDPGISINNLVRDFLKPETPLQSTCMRIEYNRCGEFIDALTQRVIADETIADSENEHIVFKVARLLDARPFNESIPNDDLPHNISEQVEVLITSLLQKLSTDKIQNLTLDIVKDNASITCGTILLNKFLENSSLKNTTNVLSDEWINTVRTSIKDKTILEAGNLNLILNTLATKYSKHCPSLFSLWKKAEPDLDLFAMAVTIKGVSSVRGLFYESKPESTIINKFTGNNGLEEHALHRLAQLDLTQKSRLAWQAIAGDGVKYTRNLD